MSANDALWRWHVRPYLRREEDRDSALMTSSDISSVPESPSSNYTDPSHSVSCFNFSSLLGGESFTYQPNIQATDYFSSSNLAVDGHSNDSFNGPLIYAVARQLLTNLSLAIQDEGQYAIQFLTQFKTLKELRKYMQSFIAEASKLPEKQETVKMTLQELRELIYEADDLVVDCRIREDHWKMKGASSFRLSPSEMSFRSETGKKLTKINSQIKIMHENLKSYYAPIAKHPDSENNSYRKTRWSSAVFDQSEVIGLTDDLATIREWILDHNEPLLHLAIVGLGGLGKTTLAKMIYRDVHLTKRFQEKIWVSVSQPVNETEIMKSMLKQLKAEDRGSSKGDMLSRISQLLSDKTYLIVLDDVWSIEDGWWKWISCGLPKTEGLNNCIIITSRITTVVKDMGVLDARIHRPSLLNNVDSWELFCKVARISIKDEQITRLIEVGKEIVKKCGGLPLAIKTIGCLLSSEAKSYSEWTRIYKNFHEKLTSTEGDRAEGNQHVIASLRLSYDELPAFLKQCLLCFSIYPEDYEIDVDRLIHWWVGEGFVRCRSTETVTESALNCLSELINRCLVEVAQQRNYDGSVYTCKMHDMVRHLTIKIAREEDFCSFIENGMHIANANSRRLGVTEDTKFQSLRGNSKLRALLLTATDYIGFSRKIELANVKSLRVLDLSHVKLDIICMEDLWHWITHLKRLAYLSLRHVVQLLEIPNSVDKLWGLQVLILRECSNLKMLPASIVNLPRLIILDVGNCPSLQCLPQGFSRLSNLQELYGFKTAGRSNAAGSHLGDLKALTELRILHIEITEESTIEDQELDALEQLVKLKILSINGGDHEDDDILRKLDKLSPPESIEELYLKSYFGETAPAWINPRSLGRLQYLCIEGSMIRNMSNSFWGDQDHKWDVKGLCLNFCPRLCLSWEELDSVMPEIRYLEVSQCYSLVSFPCDIKGMGFWSRKEEEKIYR